jgi:hypothetical protein
MSDDAGFLKIETDWLDGSRSFVLEVINEDGSLKTDVQMPPTFAVTVGERSFEQEWSILMGIRGSVGLIAGPRLKVGPINFQTVRAGVEGGLSTSMKLIHETAGYDSNTYLSNAVDQRIEGSVSAGLFGQAWKTKLRPEIELGLTGGLFVTGGSGISFEFPNFFDKSQPDHNDELLSMAAFFLETASASSLRIPVGFNIILAKIYERLMTNSPYYGGTTYTIGGGGFFRGGFSFTVTNPLGSAPGSSLGVSLLDVDSEMAFNDSVELRKDGSMAKIWEVNKFFNFTPFALNIGQKFSGDMRRKDTPNLNLDLLSFSQSFESTSSLSLDQSTTGEKQLTVSQTMWRSSEYYTYIDDITEKSLVSEITEGETINKVGQSSDVLNGLVNGTALYVTPTAIMDAQTAAIQNAATPQKWYVQREEKRLFSHSFDIGIGLGLDLGVGIDIECLRALRFRELQGQLSSTLGMVQTEEYRKDDYVTDRTNSLTNFLDAYKEAILPIAAEIVLTVSKAVTDGVQNTFAFLKDTGTGMWAGATGFLSKLDTVGASYRLTTATLTAGRMIASLAVATTVGDFYTVNMKDTAGNLVMDFSANPLTLTLGYTAEMLQIAGVAPELAQKLAIYRWDSELKVYVYHAGIVDTVNMKVTADIARPGQYILAVDDTPPTVMNLMSSDNTPTPVIKAVIADTFSGLDTTSFIFKIDGVVLVDGMNWQGYLDTVSGVFTYPVSTPLTEGNHTVVIEVKDTAGNAVVASSITITVNATPPTITHTAVQSAVVGQDLVILANLTDDRGISRGILFYRPENVESPYMQAAMIKGDNNVYTAVIPAAYVTSLGLRYYIMTEDIDGNRNVMSEPVVIIIQGATLPVTPTGFAVAMRQGNVVASWQRLASVDTMGYKLYYGESSDVLTNVLDVGLSTSTAIRSLAEGKTYYVAVAAYTASSESPKSVAVMITPVYLGNIDGNQTVDIADAILGLQLTARVPLPGSNFNNTGADVNGDGMIGMEEVIYIMQKVAGMR